MLIVEGPDGAGKSRLVKRLHDELEWPVAARAVGADTKPLVDMAAWTDENLKRGFHETIYDRHRLISEPIYGPWVRRELGEGFQDVHRLTQWLGLFDAMLEDGMILLVYCLPPLDEVMKNLEDDDDGQNERLRDEMPGIYWQYHFDFCRRSAESGGWVMSWDYTSDPWHEFRDTVISWTKGGMKA